MAEENKRYEDMTEEEINALKYPSKKEENTPREDNKNSQEPSHEELRAQHQENVVNTLNKVIRGVNDIWEKEYDFPEIGLNFKIKLHFPNAIEQGQILSLRSEYLGGMDMFQSQDVIFAFHMLATINVVGEDVPVEFQNAENIYNLQPLIIMHEDWADWLSSFRY